MAAGNAVVATDVGQTWRIVDDAVGCRVTADAPAIAGAISALLADPQRTGLGQAARERVLERYGPEPYVEGILQVYGRARRRRSRHRVTPSPPPEAPNHAARPAGAARWRPGRRRWNPVTTTTARATRAMAGKPFVRRGFVIERRVTRGRRPKGGRTIPGQDAGAGSPRTAPWP